MRVDSEQSLLGALVRGLDWLTGQQAADGGWHSATYGQLKDGAATTALALYAVARLAAPMRASAERAWTAGNQFLARGIAKRGTIASPDGTLDFPTYAAALWLSAHASGTPASETPASETLRGTIVDYLLAAQVTKSRGFDPDSPSYGGWDFLGADDSRGITTGTNVSVTAFAVEALSAHRENRDQIKAALERAKAYVLGCQQADGGIAFTCEPASLNNKAAYLDEKLTQPRSYGTATCDGLRALLACGLAVTDQQVASGIAWLAKRAGLEIVPGFEELPLEAGWQRGLRFYYYSRLAKLLKRLPDGEERRTALTKQLLGAQKADGSWLNESDRMRENDPLLATSLAIVALVDAL